MKTIKLALVIAILGLASLSYAGVDPGPQNIKMSLKRALQDPKLVRAMYDQLDLSFLQVDQHGRYIAKVIFNHNIYWIYGTYEEWLNFFSMDIRIEPRPDCANNNFKVKPIK